MQLLAITINYKPQALGLGVRPSPPHAPQACQRAPDHSGQGRGSSHSCSWASSPSPSPILLPPSLGRWQGLQGGPIQEPHALMRKCDPGFLILTSKLAPSIALGMWPEAPVGPALARCHLIEVLPAQLPPCPPAGWAQTCLGTLPLPVIPGPALSCLLPRPSSVATCPWFYGAQGAGCTWRFILVTMGSGGTVRAKSEPYCPVFGDSQDPSEETPALL